MPSLLPVLALLFNAVVWGLSWWPFRILHTAGLHPLWATALMHGLALMCLVLVQPRVLRQVAQYPALWLLALASGLTNVGFNWAVTVGDVVRVVLLFYLMPAWAVLLAWKILGEVPTRMAWVQLVLAFAGVVLVVLPPEAGFAQWATGLSGADALAVGGGFAFALTNVMLRRLKQAPEPARMLAMLGGGALLAAVGAGLGTALGNIPPVPALALGWVGVALMLAMGFLLGNYALQFGAARLTASTTALVMLTEVVFASISSVVLEATVLTPRTLAGGGLILLATLLALLPERLKGPNGPKKSTLF